MNAAIKDDNVIEIYEMDNYIQTSEFCKHCSQIEVKFVDVPSEPGFRKHISTCRHKNACKRIIDMMKIGRG